MGIFRRGRDEQDDAALEPDDVLPALSRQAAADFVVVARAAFAEAGLETTYDGEGALVGAGGRTYGLHNLSARCAEVPRRLWHKLALQHAQAVKAMARDTPLVLDEVRDRLLLKLFAGRDLPDGPPAYAPQVADDLWALVSVDHPTHVESLSGDEALDALGGLDAVHETCLANLRARSPEEATTLQGDAERADSAVHLLVGDFFSASRMLVLDHVLRQDLGVERPAHGALVAVPNRHLLAVHVLSGIGTVSAMQLLVRLAGGEHSVEGPISPHVYYTADLHRFERVTALDDDGTPRVEVAGGLAKAFVDLGLLAP